MMLTIAVLTFIALSTAYAARLPGRAYGRRVYMSEQWLAEHRAQNSPQN